MIKYILKRLLIVAAATAAALIISWYSLKDASTRFEAMAKILVEQPQAIGTPGGANIPFKIQQLMPTYAEVVTSAGIRQRVLDKLPGYSADEIGEGLRAAGIEKTQIMAISAGSADPEKAMRIAQAAALAFMESVNEQQDKANLKLQDRFFLSIISPADTSQAVVPPRRRTAVIMAAVAVILSSAAIFVYENGSRFGSAPGVK